MNKLAKPCIVASQAYLNIQRYRQDKPGVFQTYDHKCISINYQFFSQLETLPPPLLVKITMPTCFLSKAIRLHYEKVYYYILQNMVY